ncbi:T9SS type A sorting domain-containing protein [Patiriisocius sp. Uisw_017]|jgi:hypothetical protein|uniref:T9SS type A sorting domain-containing protein n=1 Tax=Patiriisocius sp. Uisw_017 TaxID=3230968 RepID=UPI0039E75042
MKSLIILLISLTSFFTFGQSIAREWNEAVLTGIRNDFARPTVHARNLFHSSVLMYDAWALFDDEAQTFFLDKKLGNFLTPFDGFDPSESIEISREKIISYALFRLIKHRFKNSPGLDNIEEAINQIMLSHEFDINFTSTDYSAGNAAALGNYMAQQMIAFGLQDGSNESNDYVNRFYEPINLFLDTELPGNPNIVYPNNWQPLKIDDFIDQSGNAIPGGTPEHLSPEWGLVTPFSLTEEDATILERNNQEYKIYNNIAEPSYIKNGLGIEDPYKWGFAMVSVWASHLGIQNDTIIDISPRRIGNSTLFPEDFDEYKEFYNFIDGGDLGSGWTLNPVTNLPYEEQMVKRSDYTRVLAEFWADGPDSETPPGHWFTILNYVNDQPSLVKKFKGEGEILSDLEWDVKAYFILGGAMHDAAISAWSNKGYYDYIRPISAIRYLADRGQSTDVNLPNYHLHGIPLIEGYIELVDIDDPLAGSTQQNLNKIKLYTWRGPKFINDPDFDTAGVGWIMAEDWLPYQRPTFVTPPFAGFVSGHSTFSRTAAEVLTLFTGSEFFPGGIGVFEIKQYDFLLFETGPTQDMELQWATYRDASEQTSLSRIWGGIHPAIDDIPGRKMGEKIGIQAFDFGEKCFEGLNILEPIVFPNPAGDFITILYEETTPLNCVIFDTFGRKIYSTTATFDKSGNFTVDVSSLQPGIYIIALQDGNKENVFAKRFIKN